MTSLCNGTAISGAEFSVPSIEFLPTRYLVAVCDDVTEITATKAEHDITTVTVSDTSPDALEIGLNCTGKSLKNGVFVLTTYYSICGGYGDYSYERMA